MILYDSFEKSGKSKYKKKKFGIGSNVARTMWKRWKWRSRCEDDGRLQTTSFVLPMTEPENGNCIPSLVWGVISANINFQILLCQSPIMLFSFPFKQFGILLFPFEFCYSFFWFYYAIMNSFIQFPILLFAFELCYAVFQSCYSIVQSSHAVSNPISSFQILLFSSNSIMPLWILLFSFHFYYSLSNYVLPNPGLRLCGRRRPGDR